MNRTARTLGAYTAGLGLAFAAAFGAGTALDPISEEPAPAHATEPAGTPTPHQETEMTAPPAAAPLPGLAVSQRGYTLVPATPVLPAGDAVPFAFTVTGPDGAVVHDFTESHEKELHLIVVRRDLAGFSHVHPERDAAGTWRVPLDLAAGGSYRVFADFTPAALGEGLTLGTDVSVAGEYAPVPLPAPAATATVDGYEVTLSGTPQAGRESTLAFTVRRAGHEIADLDPYLGAYGHLVALRTGDLAYLHTHPHGEAAAGQPGGPTVQFATTFPTAGDHRLFLDFSHGGQVHTAEFTVTVGSPAGPAPQAPGHADDAHGATPHGATPHGATPHGATPHQD